MRRDEFPIIDSYVKKEINAVLEQIRDAIEREADYQYAYVNADVAKGMYMAMEIIDKHRK
jgi:guanylate kinase